jgi:DsbC/DsbD-like thiol-disulfide interchange protein
LPGGNPRPSRCGDRDGWFGYLGTVTVAVILTAATIALPASLRCKAAYLLCGAVKAEAGAVIKVTEGPARQMKVQAELYTREATLASRVLHDG